MKAQTHSEATAPPPITKVTRQLTRQLHEQETHKPVMHFIRVSIILQYQIM